jgi:hypothetical protein
MEAVTVATVQFDYIESALLFSFSSSVVSLDAVLVHYMHFHRTYVPSFNILSNFITKAICVGIITRVSNRYLVNSDFYIWMHKDDNSFEIAMDAFLDFEERCAKKQFPVLALNGLADSLSEREYNTIIAAL